MVKPEETLKMASNISHSISSLEISFLNDSIGLKIKPLNFLILFRHALFIQHVQDKFICNERNSCTGRYSNCISNTPLEEAMPLLVPYYLSYAIDHPCVFTLGDNDLSSLFGYLNCLRSLLEPRFNYLEWIRCCACNADEGYLS